MARCILLGTAAALPSATRDNTAPVFEPEDCRVWTAPTRHSVPSVALRVEARASGVAVVYSSDTAPCAAVERLAAGAELLIHEATYPVSAAVEAERFSHTTSAQAA